MILVDCNCAHHVKSGDPEGEPIFDRLIASKLTLCIGGRLTDELLETRISGLFKQLRLAGRLHEQPRDAVEKEEESIASNLQSNDGHVIAIAGLSGCRLVFSKDQDLHVDFTNKELLDKPRGRVYQNSAHTHLLESTCG